MSKYLYSLSNLKCMILALKLNTNTTHSVYLMLISLHRISKCPIIFLKNNSTFADSSSLANSKKITHNIINDLRFKCASAHAFLSKLHFICISNLKQYNIVKKTCQSRSKIDFPRITDLHNNVIFSVFVLSHIHP